MASTRRAPAAAENEKAAAAQQRHGHSGRPPSQATKQRQKIVATTTHHQNILQESNSTRMKRPLESINSDFDSIKAKRTRITVEILARPINQHQLINPPKSVAVAVTPHRVAKSTANPPLPPPVASAQPPPPAQPDQAVPIPSKTATDQKTLTKHQAKVRNGIKHELDRLQPSAADASQAKVQQGRKLRSQEATRFKSELSAYFPDYDEVIGNDPKEHHILNLETPIIVVDSKPKQSHGARPLPQSPEQSSPAIEENHLHPPRFTSTLPDDEYPIRTYSDELFTDLFDAQRIDFKFLEASHNGQDHEDPLPDSHFEPAHKKAERLEKSIRNTEKGRAQHEKDQIIRLLNELQGPDWLRTMGVNGVTESRKKTFEPAREHFIKGCQAILEKFRAWTLEEKKRKLERKTLAEVEEEEEDQEEEVEADEDVEDEQDEAVNEENDEKEDEDMLDAGSADEGSISDGDPPDYDVDASVVEQLHEEARARAAAKAGLSKRRRAELLQLPPESYIPREFKSFFGKPHERDLALNTHRRRGRTAMAWGHIVPEAHENDFYLPEEYRDEETMKIRERRKRRDRRGHRR